MELNVCEGTLVATVAGEDFDIMPVGKVVTDVQLNKGLDLLKKLPAFEKKVKAARDALDAKPTKKATGKKTKTQTRQEGPKVEQSQPQVSKKTRKTKAQKQAERAGTNHPVSESDDTSLPEQAADTKATPHGDTPTAEAIHQPIVTPAPAPVPVPIVQEGNIAQPVPIEQRADQFAQQVQGQPLNQHVLQGAENIPTVADVMGDDDVMLGDL